MSWYRAGTISVTNGSTAVTGASTDFIANAAIGEGLLAPDGKVYEIAAIVSATALTIGSPYLGSNASGQAYAIIPSQSYIRDLAAQAATLVNGYQSVMDAAGSGKFGDGTVGSPGIQFTADSNTGFRRTGTDAVAVVTGGVDRLTVSSAGAVVVPGAVTINGAFTTASTARLPALSIGADTDVYLYESATNTLTIRAGGVGTEKYTNFGADGTFAVLNGGITTAGNSAIGDQEATDTHAIKGATTLLANSASAALTVKQTGAGNAFVVEDVASDTTPFVIDNSGRTVVGAPAIFSGIFGNSAPFEVASVNVHPVQFGRFANDIFGTDIQILKSRDTTPGGHTAVQSGDAIGAIYWGGSDGTNYIPTASILSQVDGTPGTNDMPGRLVFSTTADGASSPTERVRISSNGSVGIGSSGSAAENLRIGKNITGGVICYGVNLQAQIQSDVTSSAYFYTTYPSTQATAFTLAALRHFSADQGTINAGGSTVTSQYGFRAESSLTGATNNYGFYGGIAAGTNRYNVYMAGTAANYFGGNVTVGGGGTLGYGAGSGGTVTQATSKSTSVTLNKPSGQITMHNAALAAGAAVTFEINNSTFASTDVVAFAFSSGAAAGSYSVVQAYASTGVVGVTLINVSAGSLSEAVVLNFAVIKGSTT